MLEEKQEVIQEGAAPRWIGIVTVALAIVSLAALGFGWTASSRSSAIQQTLSTQLQQAKQNEDILSQRLAKTEDTNAQLQGELSVVTDKMKLTETEVGRARQQAKVIKENDAKQLTELQTNMTGQLATKANVDDVNKLGTDVNGVRTDLESTKNNLSLTRGEFGTLIAKNHDEVEELRRLGERDYYEFTIDKKNTVKCAPGSRRSVGRSPGVWGRLASFQRTRTRISSRTASVILVNTATISHWRRPIRSQIGSTRRFSGLRT